MPFHVYFDASKTDLLAYGPAVIPLAFTLIGLCWIRIGDKRRLATAITAFSSVLAVIFVAAIHHRQHGIARIFADHDYAIVSGEISDFRPDQTGGHGPERFRVGSNWLTYRGAVDTGGFHQLRADGGPIRDGRHVRLAVDRQGRILKLDLAD